MSNVLTTRDSQHKACCVSDGYQFLGKWSLADNHVDIASNWACGILLVI